MWSTHIGKNISISGSKSRFSSIFVSGAKNMARFLRSDVDYSWYCFTSWCKICQECCKHLFSVGHGVEAIPQASFTVSGDWTQNCYWSSKINWEWEVCLLCCTEPCCVHYLSYCVCVCVFFFWGGGGGGRKHGMMKICNACSDSLGNCSEIWVEWSTVKSTLIRLSAMYCILHYISKSNQFTWEKFCHCIYLVWCSWRS